MNVIAKRTLGSALEGKARRFPARTLLVFEERPGRPGFAAAKTGTVMVPTNPDSITGSPR